MTDSTTTSLADLLAGPADRLAGDMDRWLIEPGTPDALAEAMRYCMGGGKRLRPAVVCLAAHAVGEDPAGNPAVRRSALACEMVHVYSLVHDDLPAMDDDALRRGRPTAHVRFGEAMAILAGDALLTRAFGVLCDPAVPPDVAAGLTRELAAAAGPAGMVAGQVADMDLCDVPEGTDGLRYVHRRKTAAMFRAAARMGALAAHAEPAALGAVTAWAEHLGLAFQVVDDLLDATGTAEELGKTPGKDAQAGKTTYATLLDTDETRRLGQSLTRQALEALEPLGPAAGDLADLARGLANRTH
jgi:geranylgeranyl pyrophosphate synthase